MYFKKILKLVFRSVILVCLTSVIAFFFFFLDKHFTLVFKTTSFFYNFLFFSFVFFRFVFFYFYFIFSRPGPADTSWADRQATWQPGGRLTHCDGGATQVHDSGQSSASRLNQHRKPISTAYQSAPHTYRWLSVPHTNQYRVLRSMVRHRD